MDKNEIVKTLKEMALLMEIDGANSFRVRAFENGARTLETSDVDLAATIESGELDEMKGIGKSLAEIITALHGEGTHPELEQLRSRIPASVAAMTRIPNFGPKKAALLYHEKGIGSIEELKQAIDDGKLEGMKGFGAKTIENIKAGIDQLESHAGRFLLSEARAAADGVVEFLRGLKAVKKAEAAGSVRRWKETVHDIDVVVATEEPEAVMQTFVERDETAKVLGHGRTKSSVRLANGLQIDVRCVAPREYPHALQHFTGSMEHNVAIRSRAKKQGLKVSEWGLFKGTEADDPEKDEAEGEVIYCKSEAEIYGKLGLAYIPPELREGLEEIEWADKGKIPKLLEEKQLRGILHCHSTWSDGKASIEAMARKCEEMGYEYLGICDHGEFAAWAGGMNADKVQRQWDEIDQLNEKFGKHLDGFRVLKGIEIDIHPDGEIDFHKNEKLLEGFEFIVASVHSSFRLSRKEQTERFLRAMENPYVTIIGHPTGRILLRRDGYEVDMEALIDAAAERGVAIEINSHANRLDLDWRWGGRAREKGLFTSINPDSHAAGELEHTVLGIHMARKAAFAPEKVLNTRDAEGVMEFARSRRGK